VKHPSPVVVKRKSPKRLDEKELGFEWTKRREEKELGIEPILEQKEL
jgi:hypothetical protein